MKLSLIGIAIVAMLSIALYDGFCDGKPLGNRWYPTDPRCRGGTYPGIRLRRSVTKNNFVQSSHHYKFNPNHGECERISGSGGNDYQTFPSQSECERNCLDIYHFS